MSDTDKILLGMIVAGLLLLFLPSRTLVVLAPCGHPAPCATCTPEGG